jgi:hypothetical protein
MEKPKTWKLLVIMLMLGLGLYFFLSLQKPAYGAMGSAHEHSDFKLYINGQAYNFSQAKYMTETDNSGGVENCATGSVFAHMHDLDGNLVHKHATGATWGYFFSTLNITLSPDCIAMDMGEKYCSGNGKTLRFFVNGKEVHGLADYEIHNLDKVIITFGNETDEGIATQIATITDEARMRAGGTCAPRSLLQTPQMQAQNSHAKWILIAHFQETIPPGLQCA